MFDFFQSSQTSSHYCNLLSSSSLTSTLVSSVSTTFAPIGIFCMRNLLKCSLSLSAMALGSVSFPQPLSQGSVTQWACECTFPVKMEGNKSISISTFSISFITKSLASWAEGAVFYLSFFYFLNALGNKISKAPKTGAQWLWQILLTLTGLLNTKWSHVNSWTFSKVKCDLEQLMIKTELFYFDCPPIHSRPGKEN